MAGATLLPNFGGSIADRQLGNWAAYVEIRSISDAVQLLRMLHRRRIGRGTYIRCGDSASELQDHEQEAAVQHMTAWI